MGDHAEGTASSALRSPRTAGVLLDLNGILLDSGPLLHEAERLLLANHDAPRPPGPEQPPVARGGREVLLALADLLQVEADVDGWVSGTTPLPPQLVEQIRTFEATEAVVRGLAAAGMPMAVASGSPRVVIDTALTAIGLADLLPVRLSVDEVGARKPAPDVFLAAAERLGVPPSQCVVIEDGVPGLLAAHAAGMRCLAIPSVTEPLDPRFEQADYLVRGGMTGADAEALLDWLLDRADAGT
jgi:beta-phosphoglucomutase-like phosphatase (HAD superfamily)